LIEIQGVSEIGALILTGNRTLKNRKDFPKTVHISKTKLPKNVKLDSYEVDFLLYG
jgi:hypothetical protein